DPHAQHFKNFFDNVRKGSQETAQDPIFGFRAAAPALACNISYFDKKIINWDPVAMKIKKK
ncbi:MAG: gfo/Idh/MocA family oxidoreductase, partial [Emticicia sp.]